MFLILTMNYPGFSYSDTFRWYRFYLHKILFGALDDQILWSYAPQN